MSLAKNSEYLGLSAGEKTAVDSAITAIKHAYATTAADRKKKDNVRKILHEVVRSQLEA